VLRIHDILGWIRIRIRGSMPTTNGSGFGSGFGSGSCYVTSLNFKMPVKKKFICTIFSAYYFLKLHLHHFSKIESQKESQNSRNQGFSYYFCMMIEGSGSRRPKNMWIRIRIRNTGRRYGSGSGSGSFYHQAKIVRITVIPTVLCLLSCLFIYQDNTDPQHCIKLNF
jgi:hypothetical protein